jgi:PAS domain S-box-containing protein
MNISLHSLRTKLILGVGLVLVIILASFTYKDMRTFENFYLEEARKKALDITDTTIKSIEYPMLDGEMEQVQRILEKINALKDLRLIHLADPTGLIKYSGTPERIGKITISENAQRAFKTGSPTKGLEMRLGERIFRYTVPIPNKKACYKCHGAEKKILGGVILAFAWDPVEKKLNAHRNSVIIKFFILVVLLLTLISGLLHYMVIIPVQRLTRAAKAFAKGNLEQKIPITKSMDEVGELTTAFGEMQTSLIKLMTDLNISRDELKKMYDFQKNLIENTICGIVGTDEKENIIIFNDTAEFIFGYSHEEVIGKMKMKALYPLGIARKVERDLHDGRFGGEGKLANYETMVQNKKGEQVPVWLSAALIYEEGKEMGAVSIFRDLTEKRELEEKILHSERLASIGRGVSYICHEIKNPLTIIGGFTLQVLRSIKDEKNQQKLQIIVDEIQRLNQFLVDISDFTRMAKPQLGLYHINNIVKEVFSLIKPGLRKEIKFIQSLDTCIPESLLDPRQIKQVLINLLKNSIEAMPDGGELSITTKLRGDNIGIEIKDTGKGVPPEDLERIFDPFYTTKPKGSGLGLSISKEIIENHGGNIKLDSELGKGTTCIISLPIER